jgi:hypothetical protein
MVDIRRCGGFTLAELLVATAVAIVALGLVANLLHPVSVAFHALPEAADTQQRLRVAVQTLAEDITGAGAGPLLGWAGRAVPAWPAVLPCRWGGGPLGAQEGGCAGQEAISLLTTPPAEPQAAVAEDLVSLVSAIRVVPLSACPLSHPACRFRDDARALVADGYGAWDLVQLTAVANDGLTLEHDGSPLTRLYRAGALIGEVRSSAYSLRFEPATGVFQLSRSTNGSPDMPLLDHVTRLRFEYFGRPEQPVVIDDAEPLRRRTSFGLLPPPEGIDDSLDAWPPGENCHFFRADGQPFPRQAALPIAEGGLASLPPDALADGPWCPDEASLNRYDADLLRIRLVRITVRVQAQSPAVRGLDARLFAQPGAAREAARLVPDLEVRVDAALRNR